MQYISANTPNYGGNTTPKAAMDANKFIADISQQAYHSMFVSWEPQTNPYQVMGRQDQPKASVNQTTNEYICQNHTAYNNAESNRPQEFVMDHIFSHGENEDMEHPCAKFEKRPTELDGTNATVMSTHLSEPEKCCTAKLLAATARTYKKIQIGPNPVN